MIKAIIFDFDGVILESVDVKTEAFCQLFEDRPQNQVEAIKQYHLDNGGISRVVKIQYAYDCILDEPLPQEKLDALCQKFHDIVVDRVVNSSFVNGAKELLEYCEGKYDMFVASGTPQGEIRDIVQQRTDIAHYFKGVYGSPDKKAQIIQNILESKNLKAEEVIFIGDSHNDLEGAKTQALHFIARYYDEDQTWLKDPAINAKFPDMMPVMTYLENLNTKEQVYK